MIDKEAIRNFVEGYLEGKELFLVDVKVTPGNEIDVEVDCAEGVDIDDCVELSRAIEGEFDRDVEDYELTVGSCGLTSPFKVHRQYEMHLGDPVEVLARDGKKYRGTLDSVAEDTFTVIVAEKVKREGEKRPSIEDVAHEFRFDEVKYTKYQFD